ncbi:fumarylacetoacetate hydrolase family protein [Paractinoplanes ovalisporus]|nr:fumarylacetoacetate hydrolase family protein [Actinoplanes ovalisporus]
MRLASYLDGERVAGAVVRDDGLHPLPDNLTVDDLVAMGLERALEIPLRPVVLPVDSVTLLSPVRPTCVRDFVTFESHVEGVRRSVDGTAGVPEAWYDAPTFYFTNPHTVTGPFAEIHRPWGSQALDFELEVACVLGSGGTSLTEDEAARAVFGYTILNDWSARDLQSREMRVGLGPAKGKDFATSIGPWLVTADELADRHDADGFLDLACTVTVNGVTVGRDRLSSMGWPFRTMVAYASRDSIVRAGDVLASGTTGGGGCLAELWGRRGRQEPPPLEPGDTVAITVDRLGTLTNTVVAGEPFPPLSPFRK